MIKFYEADHRYESIVPDNTKWLGATTIVGAFEEPFHQEQQAIKSSKNTRSKWYGLSVQEIVDAWNAESKRAIDLGHWYHNRIESQILSQDSIDGLHVYRPIIVDGVKMAPEQRLGNGIYPEHLVYLLSAGITGQSDIVKVNKGLVYIDDHKTSKEITTKGYTNWEGITKKMLKPFTHLDNCHLNHYALQLSIYMYCILRHNPMLSPGTMTINHVKFKEEGINKYGYPIHYLDENKEPVVESVTPIVVPYLKQEIVSLIKWLKGNREQIIKHK